MQTNDLAFNKTAVTAKSVSPDSTSTQPAASPTPQLSIDPELLKLIDDLVGDLRKCAAHALGWRIKIGVHLHEFRDGLGVEDWKQMLQSGRLPFAARTAQTFARIGGHKTLADMTHLYQLPESIAVLNQIAALPPPVVEQALKRGVIHPGTTLAQAKSLVAQHRATKAATLSPTSRPI